jgi:hypothetical protein
MAANANRFRTASPAENFAAVVKVVFEMIPFGLQDIEALSRHRGA